MGSVRLNLKEETVPTIGGWMYWLASLSVVVVVCMGWAAYFLGSLLYICVGVFGKITKAGLPIGIIMQNIPFLILYGLFVGRNYRQFLQGSLKKKVLYLLLSCGLMLLWLFFLWSGTLIDKNLKCQFYGRELFGF